MSEKQQTKEEGGQLAIKVLQLWIKFAYKKLFFDNNLLVCRQAGKKLKMLISQSIHKIYTPRRDAHLMIFDRKQDDIKI